LKNYQDTFVGNHLSLCRIAVAKIPGIGEALTLRLAQAGYLTAADIRSRRVGVQGIGEKKWYALFAWQCDLENKIRSRSAPQVLPNDVSFKIEQRYEPTIVKLRQDLAHEQSRFTASCEEIKRRFLDQRRALEAQLKSEESLVNSQTALLEKRFEAERKSIGDEEHQARIQSEAEIDACKRKFHTIANDLVTEGERVRNQYGSDVQALNQELSTAAKDLQKACWHQGQVKRTQLAGKRYSFRRSCEYVLRGSRARRP
jgi:hypothetical protein